MHVEIQKSALWLCDSGQNKGCWAGPSRGSPLRDFALVYDFSSRVSPCYSLWTERYLRPCVGSFSTSRHSEGWGLGPCSPGFCGQPSLPLALVFACTEMTIACCTAVGGLYPLWVCVDLDITLNLNEWTGYACCFSNIVQRNRLERFNELVTFDSGG